MSDKARRNLNFIGFAIVIAMKRVTTITVSVETKLLLERVKGDETWDAFLRRVALEKLKARREEVRRRLNELLEAEYEEVRVRGWAREF